jgi:serine/threonine protein kinase
MIGQTLGHYRFEAKLGEGGMGVVYRALDTHLDRPVAIKVLRPETVTNPERKRRFVQEAKAASALPTSCTFTTSIPPAAPTSLLWSTCRARPWTN